MSTSVVKWNEFLRSNVSVIIRRYTDHAKFYCFFHILLVLLYIILYMVVCFVYFYLILYIMHSYYYVYVFLLLPMFRSRYCISLCCSVYCLCVNVYCTTATACQPNYSYQIYHNITIIDCPVRSLRYGPRNSFVQIKHNKDSFLESSESFWEIMYIINFTNMFIKFIKKNPTRCKNVSKFYYSIFIWSSTCFGRHIARHQEPKTALAASGFSYVEGCWTCSWWTLSGTVCLTTSTNYTSKLYSFFWIIPLLLKFYVPTFRNTLSVPSL